MINSVRCRFRFDKKLIAGALAALRAVGVLKKAVLKKRPINVFRNEEDRLSSQKPL